VQHLELPHIHTGERDCRGLGRRAARGCA
jgi:hypothetical protein